MGIKSEEKINPELEEGTMEGNQMKMREVLVEIRDTVNKWYDDDYISHGAFTVLWDLCSDALSAPARQCDVGTPEEQGERCMAQFDQWRRKVEGKKVITAIMAWAQEPYAAEEGSET